MNAAAIQTDPAVDAEKQQIRAEVLRDMAAGLTYTERLDLALALINAAAKERPDVWGPREAPRSEEAKAHRSISEGESRALLGHYRFAEVVPDRDHGVRLRIEVTTLDGAPLDVVETDACVSGGLYYVREDEQPWVEEALTADSAHIGELVISYLDGAIADGQLGELETALRLHAQLTEVLRPIFDLTRRIHGCP